jgi:hypothetical protein
METSSEASKKSERFTRRIKEPGTLTKWMLGSVRVTFGPGVTVQEIVTSLESISITITQGSQSITREDLESLCQRLPGVPWFVLDPSQRRHRLIFSDVRDARAAFDALQEISLSGEQVSCQLDTNPPRESASFQYCLQLSWAAPYKRLVAHMKSKHDVSNIINVWKTKTIPGVRLRVYRPVTNHFSVIVEGIPSSVPENEIHSLFSEHPGEITIVGVDSDTAESTLQDILKPHRLKHFHIETGRPGDRFRKGWAAYRTYEDATTALQAVSSKSLALEDLSVKAFLSTNVTYHIPASQYPPNKLEWQALSQQKFGLRTKNQQNNIMVTIQSNDESNLTDIWPVVNRLLLGEQLHGIDNSTPFFPELAPFLSSQEGQQFLSGISSSTASCVVSDYRYGVIRLFGSDQAREKAKEAILEKYAQLRSRRMTVQLSPRDVKSILHKGGIARLKEFLPDADIQIDALARQASCCGGESTRWKLQSYIRLVCADFQSAHHDNEQKAMDCPICLDTVRDPVKPPCSHPYCFSCLSKYITVAAERKDISFPLACQYHDADGQKCAERLPFSLIRTFITDHQLNMLLESALLNYINTRPGEFGYCPTPSCQQIYRRCSTTATFQCPSCFVRICTKCNAKAHDRLRCDEVMSDQAFEAWLTTQSHLKKCPKCHINVEKRDGCNHMQCLLCRTHFCWACSEMFTEADDVYIHMNKVHGGIQ